MNDVHYEDGLMEVGEVDPGLSFSDIGDTLSSGLLDIEGLLDLFGGTM